MYERAGRWGLNVILIKFACVNDADDLWCCLLSGDSVFFFLSESFLHVHIRSIQHWIFFDLIQYVSTSPTYSRISRHNGLTIKACWTTMTCLQSCKTLAECVQFHPQEVFSQKCKTLLPGAGRWGLCAAGAEVRRPVGPCFSSSSSSSSSPD